MVTPGMSIAGRMKEAEYSAMLGHFTERATSRGRSRSFSTHGHTTVSRNDSDQRRALLLPQEFKELGSERLVVILENCKPILAEKIRYHREPAFLERLKPPPVVHPMNMDLHFARSQQRWRYAEDELPNDKPLHVDELAHDFSTVPVPDKECSAASAQQPSMSAPYMRCDQPRRNKMSYITKDL